MFTGAAGSGESEIRRWIIENDWLEAVVALPDQLFYNTGISTYFWVVTNRKSPKRRGKIQLIDARESWTKMRKSLGNKRKQISHEQIAELTRLYGAFEEGPRVKIFPNESFGFLRITVERPLQLRWEITDDTVGAVAADKKVAKLPPLMQELLADKLRADLGTTFRTEKTVKAFVRDALMSTIGEKPTPLVNAVVNALAVRDPDAPVITARGKPKLDPTLRDYENLPLPPKRVTHETDTSRRLDTPEYRTAIDNYLQAEVHPYVPRRLARPHQNQNRIRNTPHPPLLHLHTTPPPPPNRHRNQNPRNRNPSPPCRGHSVIWKSMPIRRVFRVVNGGTPTSDSKNWEGGIRWATPVDLGRSNGKTISATDRTLTPMGLSSGSRAVSMGSLLVSSRAPIGYIAETTCLMAFNQGCKGLDPTQVVDVRFFRYQLSTMTEDLQSRGQGSTFLELSADALASTPVIVPPLAEQRAIADYLDIETGRIDALITKKGRMIELLEERRKVVTLAGVSGELIRRSPGVRSSTPWMTRIPKHWGRPKIGYVASLGSGHTPSRSRPEWWIPEECTIPWITTGEVARLRSDRVELVHQTRERISQIGLANSSAAVHPAHTVFLCRTASAGYSGIMATDMATSQDFATWTCGPRLQPRFLLLCLRAMRSDLLGRLAMGSTHKTIYMPDIQSLTIPLPPINEQREIVLAVWEQLEALGRTEDRIGEQVALLEQRRQALITAAVTGELPITGVAV